MKNVFGEEMIFQSIQEGFNITNRNWQLVLIRFSVTIINLFLMVLFIVIPVLIAVISLGVDWDFSQAKDFIPSILSDPSMVLTRYFGIAVFLFTIITLYLAVASAIILYTFGGTLGVLKNSVLDEKYTFSLSSFFREAKNLFFPLLWLLSLVMFAATGVIIVFGILTAIVFSIIHVSGQTESALSLFFVTFFLILTVLLAFIGSFVVLIYSAYSVISLAAERKGTAMTLRRTWDFLMREPKAFLFYLILLLGMLGINIVIVLFGGILQMVPAVGMIISIPFNLVYYSVQAYLGIVLWSSLLVYYMKLTGSPVAGITYDI